MFSNYTIKKVLPRIVLAAVLINVSYYIVAFTVDISNVVGSGIGDLITKPFGLQGGAFDLSAINGAAQGTAATIGIGGTALATVVGGSFLAGAGGVGAAAGAALSVVWAFVLLPALLIFVAIMATLIIRLGLIYLLILFSPVAFALYTLPNTENYFKRWWKMLYETLMVFPIIGALFGISKVMAQTIIWSTGSKGVMGGFAYILSLMVILAPLVGIPFAFKLAGGLIGQIHDLAQGQRAKMHNSGWLKGRRERVGANARRTLDTGRQKNATALQNSALGKRMVARNGLAARYINTNASRREQRVSAGVPEVLKDPRFAPVANDTDALRAGMHASSYDDAVQILQSQFGMGARAARAAASRWQATGLGWSKSAQIAAFQGAVADGTVFENNEEQMNAINKIAGGDDSLRARIWGSAYAGNKQAGRNDLSPSYGKGLETLNRMAAGETVSKKEFADLAVDGMRNTSNTDVGRMKGKGADNMLQAFDTQISTDMMELSRLDPVKDEKQYKETQDRIVESVAKLQNMKDAGMYMPESLVTKINDLSVKNKDTGELSVVGQAVQEIGGPEGAAQRNVVVRNADGSVQTKPATVKNTDGEVIYTVEGGGAGGGQPVTQPNPGYDSRTANVYDSQRGAGRAGSIPPGTPGAPGTEPPKTPGPDED